MTDLQVHRCIRLRVIDTKTNQEIDPHEIDATCFVLTVDLWNNEATQEVNLVRHSNTSPAVTISTASTTSYPPPPERPLLNFLSPMPLGVYYRDPVPAAHFPGLQYGAAAAAPMYQQPSPSTPTSANGFQTQTPYVQAANNPIPIVPTPAAGMFTRNLIGSLAVNAFKLNDDQGKL